MTADNMSIFEKIKAKHPIINKLAEWQKTIWYPALFALLGVFSTSFGMAVYIPIMWVLAVAVVFSALFCDDLKVLLVPLILAYYCIGDDVDLTLGTSTSNVLGAFSPAGLANLLICGGLMLSVLIYKFIVTGVFRDAYRKRGLFTFGLLALSIASITNGIFSPDWTPMNLAVGLLEAVGFAVVYFIVLAMTDKTKDSVAYACKVMVCLGFMISAQVLVLSLRLNAEDLLFLRDATGAIVGFQRNYTVFSWGVFNLVGAVLALCLPASMYLAHSRRYSPLSFASAIIFYIVVVFVNGRTAIVFGGVVLLVCIVACCVSGRNRKKNIISSIALALLLLVAFLVMMQTLGGVENLLTSIWNILRFSAEDNGRFPLWIDGLSDLSRAPIFGVGFMDGGYNGDLINGNMYSNFYHNIGVELLGALGIIGVIAFIIHFKNWLEVVIRKFSFGKFIICLVPALVVLMSILDNFFWYLNVQILYGVFLALAERRLEDARETDIANIKPMRSKPRVVFTLVEAGKGHITPVQAVHSVFKEKYGDRAEVVLSEFYTETGDQKLVDFEKGFALAVKIQSRNALLGKACRLGNFLSGDALGQEWLMAITPGGIITKKRGVKHMEELDADFVFTAHWATAYYAKQLKKRPYVMMFCPDAYANGMFNMDCNELLMPTEAGYKDVRGRRLYAGGNVTEVPFPIRKKAEYYRARIPELRENLGIKDEMVVTLCDGGYGMARLEETVKELSQAKEKLTIIALCGTNDEMRARIEKLETSPTVRIIAVGYEEDILGYIAVADLFLGKGGANSMAEPAYFGVPVIITKCITYIEKGMKKYYVNKVGGALYIPNAKRAAEKVLEFARDRSHLVPYAQKMATLRECYGAEKIADLIWQRLQERITE